MTPPWARDAVAGILLNAVGSIRDSVAEPQKSGIAAQIALIGGQLTGKILAPRLLIKSEVGSRFDHLQQRQRTRILNKLEFRFLLSTHR